MLHPARFGVALLTLVACTPASSPDAGARPTPSPPVAWIADGREPHPALDRALLSTDVDERRRAGWALARQRRVANLDRLRRALRDPDPEVRGAAFHGLVALETDAPVDASVLGALAAEEHEGTRAAMLREIGRTELPAAHRALAAALETGAAAERASACLALGDRVAGGRAVDPDALRAAATRVLAPEPVEVRVACAYALSRAEAEFATAALSIAAADEEPTVRAFAVRALGRATDRSAYDIVGRATNDADWRVAVQAFRSLAQHATRDESGAAMYAEALEGAFRNAVTPQGVRAGGPLHVVLTAIEAAAPLAHTTPVHDLSARLLADTRGDSGRSASRDQGLLHCAAAELADRARGWPEEIRACGLGRVSASERSVRTAAVLGDVRGAEAQRVAQLRLLLDDASPPVRQAALAALGKVWHPEATDAVLRVLRTERDVGVLAASFDALRAIAARVPTATAVPPPLAEDTAIEALREAGDHLPPDELEARIGWLAAAEAIEARAFEPAVAALATHPNHALRQRARALLQSWDRPVPAAIDPQPHRIDPRSLLAPQSRPRVRLETDRGPITLELEPDAAPVTVARFLLLVRDGFYDGLVFHRVVPNFVVQGGDPRGDGYGGPGFWQRCEENRRPYERGTVGMALAGRDTGGSQFFITHGRAPHLDGNYTAFAHVVDGLERVDELQAGDRIRRAVEVTP